MTNEDRKWICSLVYWAVSTIVIACGGDNSSVRRDINSHSEQMTEDLFRESGS